MTYHEASFHFVSPQVPSVPSNNNCLTWSGNGTIIIQVQYYVKYVSWSFHGGEIFVVLAGEVRLWMLRQTRMESPTVIQA